MKAFAYVSPTTAADAIAALKGGGVVRPLAGGQDLLARMKDYVEDADTLVNVKQALDSTVTAQNGGLKIGAAMTLDALSAHPGVIRMFSAVSEAAGMVGSPQIRHQGTVGGNVNQRPRCWYFRQEEFVCFKKGGARCFSVDGENQYHAIFGNDGPSKIVHPSSLAVPFVAYDAQFVIAGPNGEREIPAAEYFTQPTMQNVKKENVLGDNELLTHVVLPAPGQIRSGHYEVRFKDSRDWPMAFATVVVTMNGANVASAHVVLGAVAPTPWRSNPAERALIGKPLTQDTANAVAEAAVQGARPMSQNAYKIQITKTAVARAIMHAAGKRA